MARSKTDHASPRPGAWASLVPRMAVPVAARGVFVRSMPVMLAVWSLGGLYLSLVPSMLSQLFDVNNGIVNGAAMATLFGLGAAAPTLLRRFSAQQSGAMGMSAIAVGSTLVVASLYSQSVVLFFLGTAVAGIGFGAAFSAQVQQLAPLAQVHERAELFAALYAASYLFFSVPAMVAGLLISHLGLMATVEGYVVLIVLVAAAGAAIQWAAVRKAHA